MKHGKRHGGNDPVFIRSGLIDDDHQYGRYQEDQQQTPAFPDMDQHFIQVILNKNAPDNKGNDQQADGCNDPDRSRDSRKSKPDMGNQVIPMQLVHKI